MKPAPTGVEAALHLTGGLLPPQPLTFQTVLKTPIIRPVPHNSVYKVYEFEGWLESIVKKNIISETLKDGAQINLYTPSLSLQPPCNVLFALQA